MSLTIDLPPEAEDALRRRAEAEGLTPEEWVLRMVHGGLGLQETSRSGGSNSLAEIARLVQEHFGDLPPEAFEGLPKDGASQVDHYIYGTPKRKQ